MSPDATVGSEPAEAAGCRPLDEVRRALRVGGRGEDRAVVCLDAPCSGVEVLVTSAPAEIAR